MSKKIIINEKECVGCSLCEGLIPTIFYINNKGIAKVRSNLIKNKDLGEAITSCPVGAISIKEIK